MTNQDIASKTLDKTIAVIELYGIKNNNEYYIDPCILLKIIIDQINNYLDTKMTYNTLKDNINSIKVSLTKEDIINYLELKKNNIKGKYNNEPLEQMLTNKINEALYLNDEHLDYYKNYIEILKYKSILLLAIIEELIKNKTLDNLNVEYKNILNDLDIKLDNNGFILYQDSDRLIKALQENIIDLFSIETIANSLETYSEVYRYKLNKKNNSIPTKDLQIKDLYLTGKRGYINLSKNQYNELHTKSISNFQKRLERY